MGFLSWISDVFSSDPPPPEVFRQPVTVDLLLHHLNAPRGYPNNVITTSKYTVFSFIPRNLFEQFRRLSNFFFLIVMCLSLIPGASPIDPISAVAPLAAVLLAAAIKDGYEDYKRHVADAKANSTKAHVLRGKEFVPVESKDVRVGDVMKYYHGEEIRADCVLLNSSLSDGLAYIETANLDGETNAKTRKARINTVEEIGTIEDLVELSVPVEMREKYYSEDVLGKAIEEVFQEGLRTLTMTTGKLKRMTMGEEKVDPEAAAAASALPAPGVRILGSPPGPNLAHWQGQIQLPSGTHPLGIEQFIPRGCILRNTDWAIMAVVYSGSQTKMMLNLRQKPTKMSVMERNLNRINTVLFALNQACILVLCGLSVWWNTAHKRSSMNGDGSSGSISGRGTWYIEYSLNKYSSVQLFFWRYITYFILMSYMIPISLYVTLEINKAVQVLLIASDTKMSECVNGVWKYCRPKTSNLNVQLAHVRYIFTDKTGTLTENSMKYVGGYTAGGLKHNADKDPDCMGRTFFEERLAHLAAAAPAATDHHEGGKKEDPPSAPPLSEWRAAGSGASQDDNALMSKQAYQSFYSAAADYDDSVVEKWPVFQYLLGLSLCHNVVCFDDDSAAADTSDASLTHQVHLHHAPPSSSSPFGSQGNLQQLNFINSTTRHPKKVYEGQSLDEVALVEAARKNHFELVHRSARQIVIEVFGVPKVYDIIAEMDFTPARKLMSIILRRNPAEDKFFSNGSSAQSLENTNMNIHNNNNDHHAEFSQPHEGGTTDCQTAAPPVEPMPTNHPNHILSSPMSAPRQEPGGDHANRKSCGPSPTTSALEVREDQGSPMLPPHSGAVSPAAAGGVLHPQQHHHHATHHHRDDDTGSDQATPQVLFPDNPNEFLMLTKGADSSMFRAMDKASPVNVARRAEFETILTDFSTTGLRTLVLGLRVLTAQEVESFMTPFMQALCSMDDRDGELHRVYASVEHSLSLVGVTAVEDRLQDGVPETLEFLLRAEIVVWMLTGDKRETAVTIAGTSGLVDPQFSVVRHIDVSNMPLDDPDLAVQLLQHRAASAAVALQLQNLKHDCDRHKQAVVMVIDGVTLGIVLSDPAHTRLFFEVGSRCRSAVCCRMTPLQKAQIVRMFQENTQGIALAIGDGANDVSMIQESKIGIGIMGLEGSQAELASDFAIPKFRHLKRLMVVHGRSSLFRDSMVILYSVYKNIALVACLVAYCGYSGYSGVAIFDSWLLAMFNLFFCTLQPLLIGSFDKDVQDELCETHPQLYSSLEREDSYFSAKSFLEWLTDGLIAGIVCFVVVLQTITNDDLHSFKNSSMEQHGCLMFFAVVFIADVRVSGMLGSWNIILIGGCVITFIALPAFILAYSSLDYFGSTNWMVGVAVDTLRSQKLWLHLFFVGSAVVYLFTAAKSFYFEQNQPSNNSFPARIVAELAVKQDAAERLRQQHENSVNVGPPRSVTGGEFFQQRGDFLTYSQR